MNLSNLVQTLTERSLNFNLILFKAWSGDADLLDNIEQLIVLEQIASEFIFAW